MYVPNKKASKHVRQKQIELQRKMGIFTGQLETSTSPYRKQKQTHTFSRVFICAYVLSFSKHKTDTVFYFFFFLHWIIYLEKSIHISMLIILKNILIIFHHMGYHDLIHWACHQTSYSVPLIWSSIHRTSAQCFNCSSFTYIFICRRVCSYLLLTITILRLNFSSYSCLFFLLNFRITQFVLKSSYWDVIKYID